MQTESYGQMCPLYEEAAQLLGKRWTGLILRALMGGPRRFRDLQRSIPDLSDRLLSERLKELEKREIVSRKVYPETPVKVEYSLTDRGYALEPVVEAIQNWAEEWLAPGRAPTDSCGGEGQDGKSPVSR